LSFGQLSIIENNGDENKYENKEVF